MNYSNINRLSQAYTAQSNQGAESITWVAVSSLDGNGGHTKKYI